MQTCKHSALAMDSSAILAVAGASVISNYMCSGIKADGEYIKAQEGQLVLCRHQP